MAGESQATPDSTPDPTVLTTDAITRAVKAERDYVDGQVETIMAHIERMDKATQVLHETVTRTPTEIQREIKHLRELTDERVNSLATLIEEKFKSIQIQFIERDTRVEAALAAQKEAAVQRNESNNLAIGKSEVATAEAIAKLAELFRTNTDALADKIEDVKQRLSNLEAVTR